MAKKLNLPPAALKALATALLQPAPPPNQKLLDAKERAKQLFINQ